jgi:hypothetical protein
VPTALDPAGYAARRHDIPTHLDVEDRLLLGLPARRAAVLLCGLAFAFALWHQWAAGPPALRAAAAAVALLVAAAAFVRPGGRGLEAWGALAVRHAAAPRACAWRPLGPDGSAWAPGPGGGPAGWEDLAPRLDWAPSRPVRHGRPGATGRAPEGDRWAS